MTLFDDILTQFPPEVQATVHKIWEALGPTEKAGFLSLLSGFPAEPNLVRRLVKLSTAMSTRKRFPIEHVIVLMLENRSYA